MNHCNKSLSISPLLLNRNLLLNIILSLPTLTPSQILILLVLFGAHKQLLTK